MAVPLSAVSLIASHDMRAAGMSGEQLVTDIVPVAIVYSKPNITVTVDVIPLDPLVFSSINPPSVVCLNTPDAVANLVCDRAGHPSAIHVVVEHINFHSTQL